MALARADQYDLKLPITVKENPKLETIAVVNGRGENLFEEPLPEHPVWIRQHFANLAAALTSASRFSYYRELLTRVRDESEQQGNGDNLLPEDLYTEIREELA